MAEHEKYPVGGKESRTSSSSENGDSVARVEDVLSSPSKVETEQAVCKDCCKSLSAMENKLENMSTCLARLETKLSADVEAIFELLRAHSQAIKERKLDVHTEV